MAETSNDFDMEGTDAVDDQYKVYKKISRAARDNANSKFRDQLADEIDDDISDPKSKDVDEDRVIKKKKPKVESSLLSQSIDKSKLSQQLLPSQPSNILKKKSRSEDSAAVSTSSTPLEIKRLSSRIGDVEWMEADLGELRLAAVSRAIDKIYEMSLDDDNFDLFGNDMIQCFYDVGTVTGDPIRKKTLKYLEHLANRWKYTIMQEGWINDEKSNIPKPYEVIDCIIGMYCMERVGIRHDVKTELFDFLSSSTKNKYKAKDFFGWDPITEPPPVLGIELVAADDADKEDVGEDGMRKVPISKYRSYSNSLIHCFYADRVGLFLGCSYYDIFKWLHVFRPYKGLHELTWQDFIDQCYMITHLIFTTNNWGELQLHTSLYSHEYHFIRNYFMLFVQQKDPHLLSEFIECLRCFGCDDNDELIRLGLRTLISIQTYDGLWDDCDENYRTYHATMCSSQALLAHRYRGFGPGIPEITPLLLQWSEQESTKIGEYTSLISNYKLRKKDVTSIYVDLLEEKKRGDKSSVGGEGTEDGIASEKRLNDLKGAMRIFAKAIKSEPLAVTTSDSIKQQTIPVENTKVAIVSAPLTSEVAPLEDDGKAVQEEIENIIKHTGSFYADYTAAIPPGEGLNGRVADLMHVLKKAKELRVNYNVLKAFPAVVANLKSLAKLKQSTSSELRSVEKYEELARMAGDVVSIWKKQVRGSTAPTAGDMD